MRASCSYGPYSGFPCAPCGYLCWGSRSRSPMAAGTWGDVASNRSKQRGRRHRLPEIKDKAPSEWEPARQVAGVGDQNAVEGGAFHGQERRRSISEIGRASCREREWTYG